MFYCRDGARMHVLCLSCLSWNSHSFCLSISREGDGAFQVGNILEHLDQGN